MSIKLVEIIKVDGSRSVLENEMFSSKIFYSFSIHHSEAPEFCVKNVTLNKCKTDPGTCQIGANFNLENVSFIDFKCGDAMHIASEAKFKEVIIKGKKPNKIWMRPDTDPFTIEDHNLPETYQLDISEYYGEVVLVGIAGSKVIKDPSRHITAYASWRHDIDWNGLGIGKSSWLKDYVRRLLSSAEEGVFSLPSPKDEDYQETIDDIKKIQALGLAQDFVIPEGH